MRWSLLLLITILSGCTLLKGVSSSLGNNKGDDRIVITNATERSISYLSVDRDENERRIKPKRIICVEPSPDVAIAVSSAIEATLKASITKPGVGDVGLEAG